MTRLLAATKLLIAVVSQFLEIKIRMISLAQGILPLHPLALDIAIEYERHGQIIFEKMLLSLIPYSVEARFLEKNSTFFDTTRNVSRC